MYAQFAAEPYFDVWTPKPNAGEPDDDPVATYLAQLGLGGNGYEAVCATEGIDALVFFRQYSEEELEALDLCVEHRVDITEKMVCACTLAIADLQVTYSDMGISVVAAPMVGELPIQF